jgi:hypothetical protein
MMQQAPVLSNTVMQQLYHKHEDALLYPKVKGCFHAKRSGKDTDLKRQCTKNCYEAAR